jgi:AcrR family transcriptional regulator
MPEGLSVADADHDAGETASALPGLRERKKQRTRELIAETARSLFVERGFESVPVAEVARVAEVSEATVFNYFPTKEDLVFQRMEVFEGELLRSIRERPAGESILAAFSRFVLEPRGLLAATDQASAASLIGVTRMIAASPALLAREREIFARYAGSLTALIAEDTGAPPDDLRPSVVAHALMGTHQALIALVRRRIAACSVDHVQLARLVRTRGEQALDVLARGLGEYGVRGAPAGP